MRAREAIRHCLRASPRRGRRARPAARAAGLLASAGGAEHRRRAVPLLDRRRRHRSVSSGRQRRREDQLHLPRLRSHLLPLRAPGERVPRAALRLGKGLGRRHGRAPGSHALRARRHARAPGDEPDRRPGHDAGGVRPEQAADVSGGSLVVSMPTGQYDGTKLINIGTNRWAFRPEIGLSQPLGR